MSDVKDDLPVSHTEEEFNEVLYELLPRTVRQLPKLVDELHNYWKTNLEYYQSLAKKEGICSTQIICLLSYLVDKGHI